MTIARQFRQQTKLILFLIGLSLPGIGTTTTFVHGQGAPSTGKGLGTISTPSGTTLFIEIADSPDKRTQGLMFRPSMAPDRGMLFQFPEKGEHTFWMKNTLISLDMLWLDESGTVLHLEANVPTCPRKDDGCPRYRAPIKSLQVLELNAGMAKKLNLTTGSKLTIDLPPMSFPY